VNQRENNITWARRTVGAENKRGDSLSKRRLSDVGSFIYFDRRQDQSLKTTKTCVSIIGSEVST
jgi:hypothetical protein